MRISLWLVATISVALAFIVGKTEPPLLPSVGWIVIERDGKPDIISFHIDQLQFDIQKNRWFVRTDDGLKYYVMKDTHKPFRNEP